jgi:3-dehydroquinate synthase
VEVSRLLATGGYEVETIGVPDRDQAKTLEVVTSVYESLSAMGLGRGDTVVGVGGGSVTDLAGFVAGTWLRGVEVVHVPTTLLGAVDAAIGGKAGVNLAGKNLIGVFWHPSRVIVNTSVLRQLPASLLREGMVEALKAGMVGDPGLFELLETEGLQAGLAEVVERSMQVKIHLVTADEREQGDRAFLNLGHTVGHAVEFASTLSHGDSVGIGLVAAAAVSRSKSGFAEGERVIRALKVLGAPTGIQGLDRARVMELMDKDKKRDANGIRMVLVSDIGRPIVAHVTKADLELGLRAVGL